MPNKYQKSNGWSNSKPSQCVRFRTLVLCRPKNHWRSCQCFFSWLKSERGGAGCRFKHEMDKRLIVSSGLLKRAGLKRAGLDENLWKRAGLAWQNLESFIKPVLLFTRLAAGGNFWDIRDLRSKFHLISSTFSRVYPRISEKEPDWKGPDWMRILEKGPDVRPVRPYLGRTGKLCSKPTRTRRFFYVFGFQALSGDENFKV